MNLFDIGAPLAEQCSRADCRAAAEWRLLWRNPKIHTADRQKVWLACAEHREFLEGFLRSRAFPVAVEAVAAA